MQKSIIERALELAATGEYARIDHIERKLNAEGYSNVASHLDGPTIRRQLRQAASEARGEPAKRRGRPPVSDTTTSDAPASDPVGWSADTDAVTHDSAAHPGPG